MIGRDFKKLLSIVLYLGVQFATAAPCHAQMIDYPSSGNFLPNSGSHNESDPDLVRMSKEIRCLRKRLVMDHPFKTWDDRFCESEKSLVQHFGELSANFSTSQIKKMIGSPDQIEQIEWLSSPEKSQSWLYVLGRTPILLRLVFHEDKCIQVNVQPYDLDGPYCKARKAAMEASVRGKTMRQILESEGPPADACELSVPPGLSHNGQIEFWLNALSARDNWTYELGDLEVLPIRFKGNVCTGPGITLVDRPGAATERTPEASFKMPGKN